MTELFAGRYELGEVLGSGGTGVVRRARDKVLDRPVALNMLRPGTGDETVRARLRAEARLAGALVHPGVAQVYDYGEEASGGEPRRTSRRSTSRARRSGTSCATAGPCPRPR